MEISKIKALDHQYVMQTYGRYPIALIKGKGTKVWDADDKEYLDFLSGIAVNPLGHCHPAVINAITQQAQTLMHASNLYYTQPCIELAKLLVENGGLDKVFFCNSGAEANEAAIKLARKYHWRKGLKNKSNIIAMQHSFHGRTLATLAVTAKPEIKQGFGNLPTEFQFIEFNDVSALKNTINENTAAVLIEPVQGEGGIHLATPEFLQAAREICNKFNAVLIFDEIQCGLGRMGTLFAYQSYNIKPDIITLAKGIANGLPLGAMCATNEIAQGFQPGDHATTFGGNLIATAAASAALKVLIDENYAQKVNELGNYFLSKLNLLQKKYPEIITVVRGKGLIIGVELKIDAKKVLENCHDQGLLANITAGNVLRFLPPYIITKSEIDQTLLILEKSLLVSSKVSSVIS